MVRVVVFGQCQMYCKKTERNNVACEAAIWALSTEPARLAWDDGTGAMTVLLVTSAEQTTLELRRHVIGRVANG